MKAVKSLLAICLLVVCVFTVKAVPVEEMLCNPCMQQDTEQLTTPWMLKTIGLGSGCAVQVHYRVTKCDPSGCFILKIDKMSFVGAGCIQYCPWDLYALAIGTLLANNSLSIPFDPSSDKQCLWLVQPKCWRRVEGVDWCSYLTNIYQRFIPCDINECCITQVSLTRNGCDQWMFSDVDSSAYIDYLGGNTWADQMNQNCQTCDNYSIPGGNPEAPADCNMDRFSYWSCRANVIERYLSLMRKY